MIKFELSSEQQSKLSAWLTEQNANAVAKQKATIENPTELIKSFWDMGYPYGGAVGGSTTYSFTPTSLGVVVKVTDGFTGETIDLSDYEDW
jgi:hypothetical protein